MSEAQVEASVRRLSELFAEPCCLVIGSGATVKYVGTWKTLLGNMLVKRFVSSWLSDGGVYGDVKDIADGDGFADFFIEEGYLELGEFLLADCSVPTPEGFVDADKAWQERLFSRTVAEIIHENARNRLEDTCTRPCPQQAACPLARDGDHAPADMLAAYQCYKKLGRAGESLPDCLLANGTDTTMAVVELCASGKVRHAVNYNFDLVVEETLYEAISTGFVSSDIREIHLWTYGSTEEVRSIATSSACSMVLHRGCNATDLGELAKDGTIHFYHVHGIAAAATLTDVAGELVFSQHSYGVYQENPLNWSNRVLGRLFARYNVAGVGFSGTDGNFRRFASMYQALPSSGPLGCGADSSREVVLLKASRPYRDAIAARVGDERLLTSFLEYCKGMITNYYRDYFRVEVAWVGEYSDVAEVVHRVATDSPCGLADRS